MTTRQQARKDFDAQRAAYLFAAHRLTQEEIGRQLGGLSQSRVSRLLKRAEECGWLERAYRFVPDKLSPSRLEQLRQFDKPTALANRLAKITSVTGVRVSAVHIVDSGSRGSSKRALATRLGRFGRAAAETLDTLLLRADCVAVTWGRSVSCAVDGLRAAPSLRSSGRAVRVVPVCGEPLGEGSNRDTSSHLAGRLHQILHSSAPPPPSLTGVPALIPRQFRGAYARGIRKFVSIAASHREVFGTADPLIDLVDTLFTSVGPAHRPMGFIHEELLAGGGTRSKPLTAPDLSALVAGDIGGVLLPRAGLRARDRKEVDALNEMWTGAKLVHYERIAQAAARASRPGIVVLSIGGEGRAEIIAEAVRHGLVNELVIDRMLSEALEKALEA